RTEGSPVPETGEHLDGVLFDLLSRRAPVALLPAPQVAVDRLAVELEPRGQAAHDRDERRPVRLSGGCQAKRHGAKPRATAARITSTGGSRPVHRRKLAAPCRTSASRPSTTRQPAARAAATSAVSSSPYARSTTVWLASSSTSSSSRTGVALTTRSQPVASGG